MKRVSPSGRQSGVSLIEVLVAILVVSLGLLAMAGLLGTAARFGKTSELRATATLLAQDMADRMRANEEVAVSGSYNLLTTGLATSEPDEPAACDASDCTATELAELDLAQWQAALFKALPSGTGHVNYASNGADLWVIWRDPAALDDDADKLAFLTGSDGSTSACPPGFNTDDPVPTCMYFRVTP